MSIFDNFSKIELENVLKNNDTWSGILKELGAYDKHNKMVPTLKRKLDELNIDYSFLGKVPNRRNKQHCHNKYTKFSDEDIFKKNNQISLNTVRRAFKNHKEIPYECSICKLPPFWQGQPLVLTMDHIDGDTDNNEFDNLRWICPNCDRQLPTYANRNKRKINKEVLKDKKKNKNNCPICNNKKYIYANFCFKCTKELSRKVKRPPREVLKEEIRENSMVFLGKKYEVSDNTIRKWCEFYGLPYKRSEIKQLSNEEWIKI